jgi:hypothetical protein
MRATPAPSIRSGTWIVSTVVRSLGLGSVFSLSAAILNSLVIAAFTSASVIPHLALRNPSTRAVSPAAAAGGCAEDASAGAAAACARVEGGRASARANAAAVR